MKQSSYYMILALLITAMPTLYGIRTIANQTDTQYIQITNDANKSYVTEQDKPATAFTGTIKSARAKAVGGWVAITPYTGPADDIVITGNVRRGFSMQPR